MKDLVIIGAGGMGREAAFLAERMNEKEETWNLLGFVDENPKLKGSVLNGYRVYEKLEEIPNYDTSYVVCAIGVSKIRKKVIEKFQKKYQGLRFATLIDPSVILSKFVEIGEGSIVSIGSILTVNISIGKHVIVNTACTLGHDAKLEDFVSLYPAVNLAGNTVIKEGTEIGTGTQVIQGLTIGENAVIGAGAVVVREIPANSTAVGCPAKVIKVRKAEG